MEGSMLLVLCCAPASPAEAEDALLALRRMAACGLDTLLFCDLPAARGLRLPQDEPILKTLQSGVMAIDARSGPLCALLVRERAWDDAAQRYLGAQQKTPPRRIIAQLMRSGETEARFMLSTLSPEKLRGCCEAVLLSPLSLICTPDTPHRMLRALSDAPGGVLCPRVLPRREYPQTALARLHRFSFFSLCPLLDAQRVALARRGYAKTDGPVLCRADVLIAAEGRLPETAPAAPDCVFIPQRAPSLSSLFSDYRAHCLRRTDIHALLPLVRLLLLFLSAASGHALPALLSVFLPELCALRYPGLLPGALTRLSLLPLSALISLDGLLCRLFARTKLLRPRLPEVLFSPVSCALCGAALLLPALQNHGALTALLPASLLFFAAPLVLHALRHPTLERIPLSSDESQQLRSLAENAFFDAQRDPAPPPALGMLAACAGAMLGLVECDEAARRSETLLRAGLSIHTPAEEAAALVCAQYLREQMSRCDAALRGLPAEIECAVLALPPSEADGMLGALLRAARRRGAYQPPHCAQTGENDALFLPLGPTASSPRTALSLPLTHPHTFLDSAPVCAGQEGSAVSRFLFLAAGALSHPFFPLLLRSPVSGPYAPLLYA